MFALNTATGEVTTLMELDREVIDSYVMEVVVADQPTTGQSLQCKYGNKEKEVFTLGQVCRMMKHYFTFFYIVNYTSHTVKEDFLILTSCD